MSSVCRNNKFHMLFAYIKHVSNVIPWVFTCYPIGLTWDFRWDSNQIVPKTNITTTKCGLPQMLPNILRLHRFNFGSICDCWRCCDSVTPWLFVFTKIKYERMTTIIHELWKKSLSQLKGKYILGLNIRNKAIVFIVFTKIEAKQQTKMRPNF